MPCRSAAAAAKAIRDMTVRGAPLIGQVAAWGLYFDLVQARSHRDWASRFKRAAQLLDRARPTARNLKARLDLLKERFGNSSKDIALKKQEMKQFLLEQEKEWEKITAALAEHGAALLPSGAQVITHCNTGRLATLGRGTAFAVIDEAYHQGKLRHAYACETRPYLQGMRLTMWELRQAKIPSTLITDSMAAYLMSKGGIHAVLTGADRVAANGDSANKIGTLSLAIAAKYYGIPFYIVAPKETIDLAIPDGSHIVIEERSSDEVVEVGGRLLAPKGIRAWHPAFDVTPHNLISGIVTEEGVWNPRA